MFFVIIWSKHLSHCKTIQGCDCMSMQQLSYNYFSMLLPAFFHFLRHHLRVPFLVSLTIWKENLIGTRGSKFKKGLPFFGKNCIVIFLAKTLFFTSANIYLLAVLNTLCNTCKKTCQVLRRDGTKANYENLRLDWRHCSFLKAGLKLGRPKWASLK